MGESLEELLQLVSSGGGELCKNIKMKLMKVFEEVEETDYYEMKGENYNVGVGVNDLQY